MDGTACLAVMRSNVPGFFLERELDEYELWLASRSSPYLVIVAATGEVLACGGYAVDAPSGIAGLTWGMVAAQHQRRGLGSLLLDERIARIARDPKVREIRLDTSQHSRGFFERHGFEVSDARRDGYGPGLDRIELRRGV